MHNVLHHAGEDYVVLPEVLLLLHSMWVLSSFYDNWYYYSNITEIFPD